jgi:hypothetical protein
MAAGPARQDFTAESVRAVGDMINRFWDLFRRPLCERTLDNDNRGPLITHGSSSHRASRSFPTAA